jgi:predicted nucleic acid-binding protein
MTSLITSIDSNVLIALWDQSGHFVPEASRALSAAASAGSLVICGPVFAELLGFPGRSSREILNLLGRHSVGVDWSFGQADWEAAGMAYQGYVTRRRSSSHGQPRLMLTEFMIGTHAQTRGYRLLTLDQRIYSAAFPHLRLESF